MLHGVSRIVEEPVGRAGLGVPERDADVDRRRLVRAVEEPVGAAAEKAITC